MSANNPVFSSYRNTRKIANMLIRASKLIKQCCFTAILITRFLLTRVARIWSNPALYAANVKPAADETVKEAK